MGDMDRFKKLVTDIQGLSQVETEEIFKIVHESSCDYTKNNNGIFVNLAWLSEDTIQKLERYVKFCVASKQELTKYESLCDVLNHRMIEYIDDFPEVQASCLGPTPTVSSSQDENLHMNDSSSRVSSSLRYYLLKKRYSKQMPVPMIVSANYLSKDPVVIE